MYADLSNSREMLSQIVAKKHFKDVFTPGEQCSLKHLEKSAIDTEKSMKPIFKNINQQTIKNTSWISLFIIFYQKATKLLPKYLPKSYQTSTKVLTK